MMSQEQLPIPSEPLWSVSLNTLTDEEIENIFVEYADLGGDVSLDKCLIAYRKAEQKLKEKNHGTT